MQCDTGMPLIVRCFWNIWKTISNLCYLSDTHNFWRYKKMKKNDKIATLAINSVPMMNRKRNAVWHWYAFDSQMFLKHLKNYQQLMLFVWHPQFLKVQENEKKWQNSNFGYQFGTHDEVGTFSRANMV